MDFNNVKKVIRYILYIQCLLLQALLFTGCAEKPSNDVIVIGDGTGAVAAAIQSSRSGARTLLLKTIPWLGGMLTSAGVSATDGNHELPAGLWGEFRDSIYAYYGGPEKVFTGWVSNTQFEPHVGNRILHDVVAAEPLLDVKEMKDVESITKKNKTWIIKYIDQSNRAKTVSARIIIDGTDLGDIAAKIGVPFDVGMEDKKDADELVGNHKNEIIQDLTYTAILEESTDTNYQKIVPSKSYNPQTFYCACEDLCDNSSDKVHPCETMINYAKLPNNKYLINWPIHGNDIYLNVISMNNEQRMKEYERAKEKTLDFVYFIQNELGYKNLKLSTSEFGTPDLLPYMPYHREGRRIKGKVRLSSKHIKFPQQFNLYKTGIAVGNYPIDHHHKEVPEVDNLNFPEIPSYSIPMGCLIPANEENFLVADKAISVSNIANGTTRLQPVILQIEQVAGLLAALSIQRGELPSEIDVRAVQNELLDIGGYISPAKDVPNNHPAFIASQKIAACGLVNLEGRPYKWANETLFHPDSLMLFEEAESLLSSFYNISKRTIKHNEEFLNISQTVKLIYRFSGKSVDIKEVHSALINLNGNDEKLKKNRILRRIEYVYILDQLLNPFERKVDIYGNWLD